MSGLYIELDTGNKSHHVPNKNETATNCTAADAAIGAEWTALRLQRSCRNAARREGRGRSCVFTAREVMAASLSEAEANGTP